MKLSRKFTLEEQLAFAKLSGDYNPIHADPVAARRLIFGSIIVHAAHLLLWSINNWLENKTVAVELDSLKAIFQTPIRLEEEVSYFLKSESKEYVEIELLVGNSVAMNLKFNWHPLRINYEGNCFHPDDPKRCEARILSLNEVEKASGSLELYLNPKHFASLFPRAAKLLSLSQAAPLLAINRLVGMECPGLHSLCYIYDFTFNSASDKCFRLSYKTTKLDRRFGLISMKVISPTMAGVVTAFLRPPPQKQISFKEAQECVNRGEFVKQRALVIGGSRGLGEVTAKLLAAGGAEVKITYYQGEEDARRVVAEVSSGGGSIDSFFFNVLDHSQKLTEKLGEGWAPTFLYYFATPFIFSSTKGVFSASLFQKFCDYYITGFLRTFNQLKSLGLKGVLYPSSVALDELPTNMGEYTAAKMAGEVLCAFLQKTQSEITIYKPRLPRMATDQTVSLLPVNNQSPGAIMLEHLRYLRKHSM
jgi:hypothetical protein